MTSSSSTSSSEPALVKELVIWGAMASDFCVGASDLGGFDGKILGLLGGLGDQIGELGGFGEGLGLLGHFLGEGLHSLPQSSIAGFKILGI
ncbi:hypothetical protein CRG98_014395 [Punica granatum]|uniref:Uncharacterized protein n=1 Tax=Punica granatum TaxID=22663 RepID=A0A2I0KBV4_PUNGR|nr:hypothetical protein CRG98_014395 [Punica granatum]